MKILVHLLLKLLLIIYQPLRTHVNIFDEFSKFSPRKLWKSKMNLVLNWNACHVKEHNIQALKNSKAFSEKFDKVGCPQLGMIKLLVQWSVAFCVILRIVQNKASLTETRYSDGHTPSQDCQINHFIWEGYQFQKVLKL